jgi:hypothetical protein
MPPDRPKQHRSAISVSLKHQICEWSKNNKNKKHEEIADHFNEKNPTLNIHRSTVTKILSQSEKWSSALDIEGSKEIYKHKGVKFPELDRAMCLWVESVTTGGVILTDSLIKEKARFFANAFNIQEDKLIFSNGWLDSFKRRNNIRRYRIHGESGSAPIASLPEERMKLRQLLSRYTLDKIYNIDETGLYYRMSPNQTLSTKPVRGEKKDKTRITILLGTNAIGTDKLKPWVIGNAKCPRPLSKINMRRLPVYYRGNSKAWMNSTIFEEVLRELDSYFRAKNKKILLLIDNAPSHFDPNLSNEQDEDSINEETEFASTSSKFL